MRILKLIPAIVFCLALFSAPAHAMLYQYSVNAELNGDTAHYTMNLIFVNHEKNSLSLMIEGSPRNINTNPISKCVPTEKALGTQLDCDLRGMGSRFNLQISFDRNDAITKNGGYVFKDTFEMPEYTETFFLTVKLPEATGLVKTQGNDLPYTPAGASLGLEGGRRPILVWEFNEQPRDYEIKVSVAYESFLGGNLWLIGIIIALIAVIGIVLYFMKFKYRKGVKIVLPVLKHDEKKVVESILSHQGIANQKVIVKESGYSKAKVSKVLKSLSERGMIRLERVGRTNKVYLEKEFKKEE